ncbi:hypothetical protein [Absidia glauca]|uniref:F-box domain-containing protein n=1 Tax=Absidia glauca TaxID=4829 RepID=A0A168L3M1_ABSGL|nr:hypothetical protein [Absidia glauca]
MVHILTKCRKLKYGASKAVVSVPCAKHTCISQVFDVYKYLRIVIVASSVCCEYGYIYGRYNRKLQFFFDDTYKWESIRYLPACYRERRGEQHFVHLPSLVYLYARNDYFEYEYRDSSKDSHVGSDWHIIMPALPSLEVLVFDKPIRLYPEDIEHIHAQCPKLKSLVFRRGNT